MPLLVYFTNSDVGQKTNIGSKIENSSLKDYCFFYYFCNVKIINYTKYPVPRLRHHANPVLYFPLSQHKNRNFKYPPLIEKFNWKELFSNGNQPGYLDVGCGLGKFLVETAVAEPEINILGFEVRQNAVEWTNSIIEGENISNAHVLWYSVVNLLPFIENSSVKKIFYLFPDPWIKKRHHKRRAFSISLLNEFHRILSSDGVLYIMTDVPEVDEHHIEILNKHDGFKFQYSGDKDWDLPVLTNQEDFCVRKKIPYTRLKCWKL
ncbi:MAG TPA: tRNA (guanosine(46)-N7)-methyltransferase TrmB [Ignavibacteria bacterium]|nr:tRNA (guanosine(46)-N7)-methyltransferase TrmB [Ignavibacteria bacterium]